MDTGAEFTLDTEVSLTTGEVMSYSSSEDVREGIEFIRRKYGTRDIILVGISLGTFLGIRYMAENPNQVIDTKTNFYNMHTSF